MNSGCMKVIHQIRNCFGLATDDAPIVYEHNVSMFADLDASVN